MKLCDDHHGRLIEELYNRGLAQWMPDDPQEARKRYKAIRATAFGKDTYEPVYFAACAIMLNLQSSGINTSEADFCPICDDPDKENWLVFVAEDAFKEAELLGLKPKRLMP